MGNMEGEHRYLCEIYLRSACQKQLFAERRLRSLRKKTTEYKRKRSIQEQNGYRIISYPNRLPIEMDFDHCIMSLRSSLEHLAQLINAVIPLGLPAKRIRRHDPSVSLGSVVSKIGGNHSFKNDLYLSLLSSYLRNLTWYKELHDLRIESFHIKSGRLLRTELLTLDRQLLDSKFLLPQGMVSSAKIEEERDIIHYCKRRIKDVERVLKTSFDLLSKYLSSKLGDEWLQNPFCRSEYKVCTKG